MLPGDVDLLGLHLFEQLGPELELDRVAQLANVAADDEKVRRRIHRLDFLERADGLLDEARVDLPRVHVRVGDPGEPEGSLRRLRHFDGVQKREPTGSRGSSDSCQHRFVQEDTAADAQRSRWALAFCPQFFLHRQALAPIVSLIHVFSLSDFEIVRGGCDEVAASRNHFFFKSTVTCATFLASTVTGISVAPAYSCQATSV